MDFLKDLWQLLGDLWQLLIDLTPGMLSTMKIFVLVLVFSVPLGLIVAFGRMSKNFIIRNITKLYISVMRGTPLMLQVLVVFFCPFYLFGAKLSADYRFYAVIISFSINYAAYFAEIYRGGIESMSKGQYEAAKVLGFSSTQTFFKIILPQVIKRILPSMTNEFVILVKDTSLAYVISYVELFSKTKSIATLQKSMWAYLGAAIFYYLFNLLIAALMDRIEKKLDYYK